MWIQNCQDLVQEEDRRAFPSIELEVIKNGKPVEGITLENQQYFLLGKHIEVDLPLQNESIDDIQAALVLDQNQGLLVIDLGSKNGTKLNNKSLQQNIPQKV